MARRTARGLHLPPFAQAAIGRLNELRSQPRRSASRRSSHSATTPSSSPTCEARRPKTLCESGCALSSCSPSTARAGKPRRWPNIRRAGALLGRARNRARYRTPGARARHPRPGAGARPCRPCPHAGRFSSRRQPMTPLEPLLALAESLSRRPRRALVVARAVTEREELARTSSLLHEYREALLARGVSARAAAFTSSEPAVDLARDRAGAGCRSAADRCTAGAARRSHDPGRADVRPVRRGIVHRAPRRIERLVRARAVRRGRPRLEPRSSWAAWFAAGGAPATEARWFERPAGRQRCEQAARERIARDPAGVRRCRRATADRPGHHAIVHASDGASLVVAGLSDRWRRAGLGPVRSALATGASAPTLLVRRGLRPGGLAPRASLTRFTWSAAPRDLGASA